MPYRHQVTRVHLWNCEHKRSVRFRDFEVALQNSARFTKPREDAENTFTNLDASLTIPLPDVANSGAKSRRSPYLVGGGPIASANL